MQMKAIASNYGLEEAIKLAVNAGVDIMCFSNNILGVENRAVDRVHDVVRKFVNSGEIKKSRIDESFKRIMKLKKQISPNWEVQSLKTENQKLIKLNNEEIAALTKANEEIDQLKSGKKKKKKSKTKK